MQNEFMTKREILLYGNKNSKEFVRYDERKAFNWEFFEIPIWEKQNLTLEEYAAYSGIGINRIRELTNSEDCPFVLWVGSKRLIKRELCDEFLARQYSI